MLTSEPYANSLVSLDSISHEYFMGSSRQTVLHSISLSIPAGQSCAIIGASGSGKSTLLNLIGLLDRPTNGHVFLAGRNMSFATPQARTRARNELIGFVFQSFNLLPRLTALDNVALPLLYRGVARQLARQKAQAQLERVGLAERLLHRPADLSGGQRQRVAIARALVGDPMLILADEPTGNLDRQTAQEIITLLTSLNKKSGTTLIIVTHDNDIAGLMDRCIEVCEGHISEGLHDKK